RDEAGLGSEVEDGIFWRGTTGGVRKRMTWRQFILALGLHTKQEMAEAGFGAYWAGSDRLIPNKGDLRDYWMDISSNRDFLGPTPSYVFIRDPVKRLCHMMIVYSISEGRKSRAMLSGGHFIRRLAMHFGLETPHLHEVAEEVAWEIPTPSQAPPPPPQPRTMS
ncbi:hypothetical protein Tco_1358232, partial [Tanacetum coccineum]